MKLRNGRDTSEKVIYYEECIDCKRILPTEFIIYHREKSYCDVCYDVTIVNPPKLLKEDTPPSPVEPGSFLPLYHALHSDNPSSFWKAP